MTDEQKKYQRMQLAFKLLEASLKGSGTLGNEPQEKIARTYALVDELLKQMEQS